MTFGGEPADGGHFGVRSEGSGVALHSDLLCSHRGGLFAVSRQHQGADASGMQRGEGGGAFRADAVNEGGANGDGAVRRPYLADNGSSGNPSPGEFVASGEFTGADTPACSLD